MCAIYGVLKKTDTLPLHLLAHRGDDYSKIVSNCCATFGFNRLAIEKIDINLQPLKIGEKLFVFNGEIYNYKKLIKEYELRADTEIEVIALLWEKFGVDFVKKIEGMFAIAIFDERLYLFRDIFGKKPLYFTDKAFSSEIKALNPKKINFNALAEYLAYNSSLAPNTFYEGIYKLPAGHYAVIDKKIEIHKYYDFKRNPVNELDVDYVEELLRNSIEKRKQGEVEIASLLSGGLDSSLILALSGVKRAYSVGYDGYENYDERKYARIVADHLGVELIEAQMSKQDFFDNFNEVLLHMDEPIADSSFFAAFHLAKKIGEKVIFSGEGSDELFLGYRKYDEYLGFLDAGLPNKKWLGKYMERHYEDIKEWEIFRRFFKNEIVFRGINEVFFDRQIKKVLKVKFDEVDYERFVRNWGDFGFSYFDLKVWLGEVLMMKLDKMFMSNTIEARTPFLDKELVEYVFSLKKRPAQKEIVKQIAVKYLPKEIVYRRKKGFAVPFFEWLKEENELRVIIDVNRETKIFNEEYLKAILKTGHKRYKQHIWTLYLVSRWIRDML